MSTLQIPTPRRRRRRWIIVAVLAVILTGTSIAIFAGRNGGRQQEISADDIDLRLGKAEVGDIQVTVTEVGTIEPLVKVDVKSSLSGKVVELLVREGTTVRRGQVLARVEPDVNQAQTLSQVKSELNLAQIKSKDAVRDFETNNKLHEEGLLSDVQLREYRLKLDTANEALDAARTKNMIVEESGIPLNSQISTTQRVNVVSPMDGTVIKKNVEVGQTVTSGVSSFNEGTALYTVADVGSMLIKAAINEVDIGRVRLDMPVVISIDAFPYKRFDGKVTHISPAARLQEKIKVFDVEVALTAQVADFRAGMTANIEVRGEKVADTLGVPVEAIFKKHDKDVVYVLKGSFDPAKDGERAPRRGKTGKLDISETWQRFFEEREVKVGIASLEKAQILDGVPADARVALEDPTRPRQIEED